MATTLTIGMLSACSNETSTPPTSTEDNSASSSEGSPAATADTSGNREITVASWNVGADACKEIGEKFMEENPGTTITVQYVDGNYEKLRPALAAGTGVPDVFSTQKTDFPAFMNKYGDMFADVSDILLPEKDNFAAETISQVEKDGKYYAFPWDMGPCGLFYHKATFEEAGIDPTSLTTWDKYLEAARTVKEKTGKYMWATAFNGADTVDETIMLLHQQGGKYYDENGNVQLNSPEMLRSYEVVKTMIADQTMADIPSAWNDRIKLLNEGKLAALPYAVWFAGTMVTSVEDGKGEWGIAPLPAFEEGENMVGLGGSVLAIYKDSENVDLAKEYLKFNTMSEQGGEINLKYGLFSAYKPNHKSSAYSEINDYFGVAVGDVFAQWVDGPAVNFGAYFTDVHSELKVATGEILLNDKDPAEMLDAASERAQRSIDAGN